jgi:hypothetical protein
LGRVSKKLCRHRHAIAHASGLEGRRRARNGPWKVHQDAAERGPRPEEFREHRAGSAADIHDRMHIVPAVLELQRRIRGSVARVTHERVEIGAHLGMRGHVLPERHSEEACVPRLTRLDEARQRAPHHGHPSADSVEAQEEAGIEQAARRVIEREMTEGRLHEHAPFRHVRQHVVQHAGIG